MASFKAMTDGGIVNAKKFSKNGNQLILVDGETVAPARWFSPNSVINTPIVSNPAIHSNSTAIINSIMNGIPNQYDTQGQPLRATANVISFAAGAVWDSWDYEHPVFFASASDPLKTITGNTAVTGQQIRVPANAWVSQHPPPSGNGDSLIAIVQPNGNSYEFWQTTIGATTINSNWGEMVGNYTTGNGYPGITLGDFALGAGALRPQEMIDGIFHAIFLVTYNYSGWQYPSGIGNQPFRYAPRADVPKMGMRIQLVLTDNEINALPSHLRVLATACRDYGLICGDTGGGGLHADNSNKQAWLDAGAAVGATYSSGSYYWNLKQALTDNGITIGSRLRVLA